MGFCFHVSMNHHRHWIDIYYILKFWVNHQIIQGLLGTTVWLTKCLAYDQIVPETLRYINLKEKESPSMQSKLLICVEIICRNISQQTYQSRG